MGFRNFIGDRKRRRTQPPRIQRTCTNLHYVVIVNNTQVGSNFSTQVPQKITPATMAIVRYTSQDNNIFTTGHNRYIGELMPVNLGIHFLRIKSQSKVRTSF
jgi:hypothetical protein